MLTVTVSTNTSIAPTDQLPQHVLDRLRDRLSFENPQWLENDKRGFWNGNTPKILCYLEDHGDRFAFPRGFTRQAIGILRHLGVIFRIDDRRRTLPEVDFTFTGTLRDYQQEAVDAILGRDFGTASMPTASGKTVVALAVIAARRQPALVVCHTAELQQQWISRIQTFLGIPAGEVGRIGGSKKTIGDRITVGLVQSLYKIAAEVAPHIGFLVVDECHRAPSRTFTECVTSFDSRFMLGLSATPYRRDGLSRLIYWCLGDVVHQIEAADLQESGDILRQEFKRSCAFLPSLMNKFSKLPAKEV